MKYLLIFLLVISTAYGQTVTTYDSNGDTLITTYVPSQYTPSSNTVIRKPFKPKDTTVVPPVVPSNIQGFGAGVTGGKGYDTVFLSTLSQAILDREIMSNRVIIVTKPITVVARVNLSNVRNLTIDFGGSTIDNKNNGDAFSLNGSGCYNIHIKNLRTKNAGNDGVAINDGAHDIVFEYGSSYGNKDGNFDISSTSYNVTVQYYFLGRGDSTEHSGNSLVAYSGTRNITFHHNLFACVTPKQEGERNSLIHSSNTGQRTDLMVDFRNNLVWNWGRNGGTGSGYGTGITHGGTANVVNNYYYSKSDAGNAIINGGYGNAPKGELYAAGNYSANNININAVSNHAEFTVPSGFRVVTEDPRDAARKIKASVGCKPYDSYEQSVLNSITIQ